MTPRITLLIIVGIVMYVSLSLYHWRQVKKIPGAEKQSGVHSVLTREKQENNWKQVSTSPDLSGKGPGNVVHAGPAAEVEQNTGQQATPPTDSLPEISLATGDKTDSPPSQELQTTRSENNELRTTLQHERSVNRQQSLEIEELRAQIISLRSALDDTSARLGEKNIALEKLEKQSLVPTTEPDGTASEQSRIQTLKTFLASKTDALARANERITALAERLDQSRRTLAEAENTNAYLQSVLSNTENGAIKARHDADQLNDELILTREDKEKYLAETGRLHSQLQQTRSRLAWLDSELGKARLTSEAMLRYGKEQTELITPFRQQIEVLHARVEDKNSELLKAEEQIEQIRDQERLLQDKIQALQLELQKNKVDDKELQATSKALNSVQKHSAKLTLQLKVLADQLGARDKTIYKLDQNLTQAQTAAQDAAQRSDVLKKETEQQRQELDTARQELTTHKQQLETSTARQQIMETELDEIRSANEQLDKKIIEQAEMLEATKTEAVQLTSRLQEKSSQLAGAEDALHRSQTNDTQSKATIKQLQNALDTTKTRLTDADAEINKLNKFLTKAERKLSEDTAANKLKQELDHLKQTITDKKKQQEAVEQVVSELKNENELLQEKIRAAEQESRSNVELQSALDQKIIELNNEKKRISILENKRGDLRSELDRRETDFFNMQEEYTSLQNRFVSLQKERDTLFPYTLDSDNDAISDARDSCPDTTHGAEVDQDGCEQDSDYDGLVDRLDLCPDAPGQTDSNIFGCTRGEHIVLSGIFFSGGNAELSLASQSYLDKVAGVLELFPGIHFEVAGHTDSIGEKARNLTVSKQRAEAVTDYLVAKGIETSRLVPVGLGPGQPIADNTTPEGRAANRRVELKIITPNDTPAPAEEEKPTAAAEEERLPAR
jgi:outer membrane protein OmpA-like peptidoglycan-associated protein